VWGCSCGKVGQGDEVEGNLLSRKNRREEDEYQGRITATPRQKAKKL